MKVILDACTLINLINGEVLQKIPLIPDIQVYVCDSVLEAEILEDSQKIFIAAILSKGEIKLLESDVTLAEFNQIKNKYNLGFGETECLVLSQKFSFCLATDDRKARKAAKIDLGADSVTSSLFLLKACVKYNIITCKDALASYQLMKDKGAFLPMVDDKYLCK